MLELRGKYDIFELANGQPNAVTEAICVTTNGIVKADGNAVMGAGIALQVNKRFHVSQKLGTFINTYGNRVFNLGVVQRANARGTEYYRLFSFPTKHHFKDDSDINLIIKSAEQLVEVCDKFGITKCYLTPPGCGCGHLNYENTVRPWISQILDDRFIVVDNRANVKS